MFHMYFKAVCLQYLLKWSSWLPCHYKIIVHIQEGNVIRNTHSQQLIPTKTSKQFCLLAKTCQYSYETK